MKENLHFQIIYHHLWARETSMELKGGNRAKNLRGIAVAATYFEICIKLVPSLQRHSTNMKVFMNVEMWWQLLFGS